MFLTMVLQIYKHFHLLQNIFSWLLVTVGTCCRGGFRRAFLSEGHGTTKRESAVGAPPTPPCNMYCVCAQHEHVHTFVKALKKCRKYKFSGRINRSDV
jgi:hypothetical protein